MGPVRPRDVAVLAVVLVAWNTVLNRVAVPDWTYLPLNLSLTATAGWWAHRRGLGLHDIGLAGADVGRGVRRGMVVAVVVGLALLAAVALPLTAPLLADERAAGLGGWALLYTAAVRIPFGTALTEEVLFRGVLVGLGERLWTRRQAVLVSAGVFGLWHVGPGLALLEANAIVLPPLVVVVVVGGIVAVTAVAGVAFSLLREWSGSLVTPILAHTAINSFSLLAAASVTGR